MVPMQARWAWRLSMNWSAGLRPGSYPPLPRKAPGRRPAFQSGSWSQCAPILAWRLSSNRWPRSLVWQTLWTGVSCDYGWTSMELFVVQILALAILIALLVFLDDRRTRREVRSYTWDGTAFDADEVLRRVQTVKTNYLAALHCQRHSHPRPIGLLARACRRVSGKSYFRSRSKACTSIVGDESEDRDSRNSK